MLTSMLNTLRRLFSQTAEPGARTDAQYSDVQLLNWAQGCMLEGLPDEFYEARLECERTLLTDGKTEVVVRQQFRHTAISEFERFSPADDLYPVQCVEQVLNGHNWSIATLVFSPDKASFSWE